MTDILYLKGGATWDPVMELSDADGAPLNLTGASARLQARSSASAEPALSLDTGDGTLVLDLEAGTITWAVSAVVSAAVPPGRYAADLRIAWADGRIDYTEDLILDVRPARTLPPDEEPGE